MTVGIVNGYVQGMTNQPECVARVKDQNMISFLRWYLYKLWTLYIS